MAIRHNILHRDGAPKVYQSPAVSGQYLYFTSRGDDIENKIVGAGNPLIILEPSEDTSIYAQFLEDIQLKDAYIFWENAEWGDNLSVEIVLPANTPFNQAQNKGNANIINGVPTYITASQAPDETWTGTHLFFPVEVVLVRFVNHFNIYGSNSVGTVLESQGVALIDKDLKLKLTYHGTNSNIKIAIAAEMYRTKTV